jgi:Cys-rich four helix bundle protein (predicted Tat secretion target)
MNRRDLLQTGFVLGAAMIATTASADDKHPSPPSGSDARMALLDALAICGAKGQLCAAHCQTQLASGAKEFARCAAAVDDMLAVIAATQSLVARRSASARKLADLCAAVCKDCSAACLEHKAHWAHGMHVECKACMEACDACAKACAAFVSA